MKPFAFSMPTRIQFGSGVSRQAGAELAALGARRVFVVTGPGATARSAGLAAVVESLRAAGLDAVHWPGATADPPARAVNEGAARCVSEVCDAILAYGGGSPLDCAKGIGAVVAEKTPIEAFIGTGKALTAPPPPLVAIPTTAGTGSEVTANAVFILEKDGGRRKIGISGATLVPRVALVDPDLLAGMPRALAAATGMDALTHAVEGYVSRFAVPSSDIFCLESIRWIGRSLRGACADASGTEARAADPEALAGMAWASTLAGIGFGQAGLGMVHGIAHPLGALTGLPHGLANAVVLPHVMRAMRDDCGDRLADIGRALEGDSRVDFRSDPRVEGAPDGPAAIARLAADIGIPSGLRDAGIPESILRAVADDAKTYRRRPASPRAFTDAEIDQLVRRAWEG